jgi:hypothetical protein
VKIHSQTLGAPIFIRVLAFMALMQIFVRNGEAVTISVNSASYDVTFISGTYDANAALFNSAAMPWFGNSSLAESFALAAASALDQTGWHPFSDSPLFAFDDTYIDSPGEPWETRWIFSQQFAPAFTGDPANPVRWNENTNSQSQNYAVLTSAVPEPTAFSLFVAGGAFLLGFRRRAVN